MRARLFAIFLVSCLLVICAPQSAGAQSEPPVAVPLEDALTPPPPSALLAVSDNRGPSQYMAGHVAVRLVLPESTGTMQNWSQAQIDQIRSQVQTGLDWWAARLPGAQLRFTVRLQVASTTYEPITYGLASEGLWISDSLRGLGFTTGSYFDQAYASDRALRDELGADWATTIFVANSQGRSGGTFTDGYFAYAYVHGPFMVLTSDVGGYGASRMAQVVSHEIGHIFGALDQYAAARVSCTRTSGYLNTPTSNSQYNNCGTGLPSIMIEVINSFTNGSVDPSALFQLGYRDSDGDGLIDPLDTAPSLSLSSIASPATGARPVVSGQSYDIPFPSPYQQPVSINRISAVEYRVNAGLWLTTTAADGAFDSADELFTAELPLYDGQYLIELRARNSVGATSPIITRTVTVSQVGAPPDYHPSLPAFSAQPLVRVQLGAPAATQAIQISKDLSFADITWLPYSSEQMVDLGLQEGERTIYLRYRDAAGRDSLPISLTATIDTTPPTGMATLDPAHPSRLILSVADSGAGVTEVGLQISGGATIWLPFQPVIDLSSLSGLAAAPGQLEALDLRVLFRDAAGNTSPPYIATSSVVYLPMIIS